MLYALRWKGTSSWNASAFYNPLEMDDIDRKRVITWTSKYDAEEVHGNLPYKQAIKLEVVEFVMAPVRVKDNGL